METERFPPSVAPFEPEDFDKGVSWWHSKNQNELLSVLVDYMNSSEFQYPIDAISLNEDLKNFFPKYWSPSFSSEFLLFNDSAQNSRKSALRASLSKQPFMISKTSTLPSPLIFLLKLLNSGKGTILGWIFLCPEWQRRKERPLVWGKGHWEQESPTSFCLWTLTNSKNSTGNTTKTGPNQTQRPLGEKQRGVSLLQRTQSPKSTKKNCLSVSLQFLHRVASIVSFSSLLLPSRSLASLASFLLDLCVFFLAVELLNVLIDDPFPF